jgi:iron complex outermembrane receptor protein
MRYGLILFLLCAACFHVTKSFAQTDSIRAYQLDSILIEGFNSQKAHFYLPDQLDTFSLKRMPTRNLSDLLSRTSSVFVKNYGPGNISAITIRGMSASQTKINWNGLELNSPMYGMADLNLIPVAVFNSAFVNPGQNAIGGTVNLFSNSSYNGGISVSALQSFESFDTRYSQLSSDYGGQKDNTYQGGSTKLYYRGAKNDFPFENNARFGSPVQRQVHSATTMYGLFQQYNHRVIGGGEINAMAWLQHNFRELPPPLTSVNNRETQEDNSARVSINYGRPVKWGTVKASAGINSEELMYNNEVIGIYSHSRSNAFTASGEAVFYHNAFDYRAKLTGKYITAAEGRYFGDKKRYEIEGNLEGLSNKYHFKFTARPQLVDFRHLMPNFLIGWWKTNLTKKHLIFSINASGNFKYPTLNDLYWIPGGNDSLKPEKAFSQEVILQCPYIKFLQDGEADMQVSGYSIYAYDFILWQPADAAYWKAQNLREVWSRGAEASARFRKPIKRGSVGFNNNFNYTRATTQKPINPSDKSVGRQLIYVPRFTFQSSLQLDVRHVYAGAYYTYTDYRRTPDGYLLPYQLTDFEIGIHTGTRVLESALFFRVNNIFNESYQVIVWRPMPGRWYSFTLHLTWKVK